MGQHLINECRAQHVGLVLELDRYSLWVEHNRQGQRKLGGYRAQFELSYRDTVQYQSTCAVAHAETQADQLVHAIVPHCPLRVGFAHHSIDANGLVGEPGKTGFAYRVDERGERVVRSNDDPQQQRVAEVPDRPSAGALRPVTGTEITKSAAPV